MRRKVGGGSNWQLKNYSIEAAHDEVEAMAAEEAAVVTARELVAGGTLRRTAVRARLKFNELR